MRTITFEVHSITPTFPRNTLTTIFKSIVILFAFIFFAYFSLKQTMHVHIRDRKEIPNYVKHLTFHFRYVEAYKSHFMIGRQRWWDGYLCISLRIFLSFSSKRMIRVLSTRDDLTLLITNMSHKAHLLSCALRYLSKLQMIQSLKNFISMAIQGTQVPMYTNTHYFCIFLIFSNFFYFMKKTK